MKYEAERGFEIPVSTVGPMALEPLVPELLAELRDPGRETALVSSARLFPDRRPQAHGSSIEAGRLALRAE